MNTNQMLMEVMVKDKLEARRREARNERLVREARPRRRPAARQVAQVQWRRRLAYLLVAVVVPALYLAAQLAEAAGAGGGGGGLNLVM